MPPTYTHVIEFDEAELICRMVEALTRDQRPPGVSANDAVTLMPPEARDGWLRVAEVVRAYWHEVISNAKRVQ